MITHTLQKTLPYLLIIALFITFGASGLYAQTTADEGSSTETTSTEEVVSSEETAVENTDPDVLDTFGNIIQDRASKFREDVDAVRSTLQEKRIETRSTIQEEADDMRVEMRTETREEMRESLPDAHSEVRAEMAENRIETREEKKEQVNERRAELEEKKSLRESARKEAMKERARAYIERTIKRFEAAIERLEIAIERVESRMDKFYEAKGIDNSVAIAFLEQARNDLASAKASLASVNTSVEVALSSDDPKEAFNNTVKTTFEEAKKYIKSAHASITDAVASIKSEWEKLADIEMQQLQTDTTDEN